MWGGGSWKDIYLNTYFSVTRNWLGKRGEQGIPSRDGVLGKPAEARGSVAH